jgi:Family of unknown function (DUF5329)
MMNRRLALSSGAVCCAAGSAPSLLAAGAAFAQEMLKPAEAARIEKLIAVIESRHELSFVRNGRAYNCTNAARFLREKLKAMGGDVTTAKTSSSASPPARR